jgi:hypothetical protein
MLRPFVPICASGMMVKLIVKFGEILIQLFLLKLQGTVVENVVSKVVFWEWMSLHQNLGVNGTSIEYVSVKWHLTN